MDNYVHLHECSPFWIGIFIYFIRLLFDIDLRIVIEKVLNHVYAIGKSNIMLTWEYIVVLNIKGKHNFKHFTIYTL